MSWQALAARRQSSAAGRRAILVIVSWLLMPWLTQALIAPSALAEEQATPSGRLVRVVMLSRHGVRSPIPSQSELDSWTASQWPIWHCGDRTVCDPGQLTLRGRILAEQMGHVLSGTSRGGASR